MNITYIFALAGMIGSAFGFANIFDGSPFGNAIGLRLNLGPFRGFTGNRDLPGGCCTSCCNEPDYDFEDVVEVQESSVSGSLSPERALDGISLGKWQLSCAQTKYENEPWWYVQFQHHVTIRGVIIYNHDDTVQTELSSFEVAVTNSDPPQNYSSSDVGAHRIQPFSGTLQLKFKAPLRGIYLVVKLRKLDYLPLCQIQWVTSSSVDLTGFVDGDTLVRVLQSSLEWGGQPERALDGNMDGDYSHGSCSSTHDDNEPWWYVEFINEVTIYGVALANRDQFQSRLTMFEVAVTIAQPPQNYAKDDVGAYRAAEFTGTLKLKLKPPQWGRYLVVKLLKKEYLTLCEVKWVTSGADLTGFIDGDVAHIAHQISTADGAVAERGVDGKTNGDFTHGSCSRTLEEKYPWWYVDLVDKVAVYGVKISNSDQYKSELVNILVGVTNITLHLPPNFDIYEIGTYHEKEFSGTLKLKFYKVLIGQYLYIIRYEKTSRLTLCEVEWMTREVDVAGFVESDPFG